MEECERIVGDAVEYCRDMYEAATDADALMLVTEWKEFRMPSWSAMQRVMNGRVVFDGRNIYERSELEALGFVYYAIGK
jgi:UDPglucose 6-dehydrogenase